MLEFMSRITTYDYNMRYHHRRLLSDELGAHIDGRDADAKAVGVAETGHLGAAVV